MLGKCKNCGAQLEPGVNQSIKCAYCGTVYQVDQPIDDAIPSTPIERTNVEAEDRWQTLQNSSNNGTPQPGKRNSNEGCIGSVLIAIVIVFIFIGVVKNSGQGSANYVDSSAAIDTSHLVTRAQPKELSETEQVSLKKLAGLNVDRATFKQLYLSANISIEDFAAGNTSVKDKKSISSKPVNGLYTYIEYNDIAYLFYFASQYISNKPKTIKSLTLIINGKSLRYSPSFTPDSIEHQTKEYSEEVIYDDKISMLLKLATADKVIISFNGKKWREKLILPKEQQDALKRQLQLYKGLLLGYAK